MNRIAHVVCGSLALSFMSIAAVTACSADPATPPIRIGALLTLSGTFAAAGEDCRRGIEAGLDAAHARELISIVYADSKNEPATAVTELARLKNQEKTVAVYTHRSTIGMALNPVSQRLELPLLGAVSHKDFAVQNPFAWQLWSTSTEEGEFLAAQFKRRGLHRVAVVSTEDDWTLAVSAQLRSSLGTKSEAIVFDEKVQPADTDFRSMLLKLRQTAPDVVFVNVVLPQIAPLIRQLHQNHVSAPLFSNFYIAKKDILEALGPAELEGIRYAEIDTALPSLQKQLGLSADEPPPGLSVASYLGTLLIVQAVRSSQHVTNTEQMNASLLAQQSLKTPDGDFSVRNRHVMIPVALKTLHHGHPVKEGDTGD